MPRSLTIALKTRAEAQVPQNPQIFHFDLVTMGDSNIKGEKDRSDIGEAPAAGVMSALSHSTLLNGEGSLDHSQIDGDETSDEGQQDNQIGE